MSPSRRSRVIEDEDAQADHDDAYHHPDEPQGGSLPEDDLHEKEEVEEEHLADLDEYGMDSDLRQRLQPEQWEDAVISSANQPSSLMLDEKYTVYSQEDWSAFFPLYPLVVVVAVLQPFHSWV